MTYDNAMAFDIFDRDQARRLSSRPTCGCCGEPIQEDYYYDINGMKFCKDCIEENIVYTD